MALSDEPVLFLDCQTTGTQPHRSHVVEVAWLLASAQTFAEAPLHSFLVQLPEGAPFPRAAQDVSGLSPASLAGAAPREEVQARLRAAIVEASPRAFVAHSARFEEGFLAPWFGDADLPPFLCTLRFAGRLLPGLPSRTLRAVSGHLGHGLPEEKRSAPHVRATAFVWAQLVRRFEAEHGPSECARLALWLAESAPRKAASPKRFLLDRNTRLQMPARPGVYRFLAADGRVLYVGKATSLRDRVNSYFRGRKNTRKQLAELVSQVVDVQVTETATQLEAALLEVAEITRLDPPYNVLLRETGRDPRTSIPFFDELAALATELAGGPASPLLFWELDDEDIRAAGLALFRRRHKRTRAKEEGSRRRLLALGFRLARAGAPLRRANADEERVWTPEEVAASAERVCQRAALASRRTVWLSRLSESVVRWRPAPDAADRWLRVRAGRVEAVRATEVAGPGLPPTPLDEATHRCLSVLWGELRRLSKAGIEGEIRFGKNARRLPLPKAP